MSVSLETGFEASHYLMAFEWLFIPSVSKSRPELIPKEKKQT